MNEAKRCRSASRVLALILASLLGLPGVTLAQLGGVELPPLPLPGGGGASSIAGSADAVRATVLGMSTTLAGTGTLGSTDDAREASVVMGSIPSVLTGEALHASTIGWSDQVASEASMANLAMNVGGMAVSADFIMARALDVAHGAGAGASSIEGLTINGIPIAVTGAPNQAVWIPGGQLILNEQVISPAGTTVNALHLVITGVADVVIASAKAAI